jgi:hypothetical protein
MTDTKRSDAEIAAVLRALADQQPVAWAIPESFRHRTHCHSNLLVASNARK